MTPEDVFNSAQLDLLLPDQLVDLPDDLELNGDTWLSKLNSLSERKQAFFGKFFCRQLLMPMLRIRRRKTAFFPHNQGSRH
jgi:hypothetical protein